ncbi:probable G-protein coupled receptor 139 [Heptranchias perlo]|uniref:probable G-protein coupled receptor 139 n=1 Tax=Heptranchias perlo TaxID=212740 RepID=UPI0035593F63
MSRWTIHSALLDEDCCKRFSLNFCTHVLDFAIIEDGDVHGPSSSINVVTIVILSRGKCGLSKCVTRYLVAMAAADLLVVIVDLILRQIPIVYREQFKFLQKLKTKYCTEKTAAVVLGTVTVLSGLKNIFWYFLNTNSYWLTNTPWFCRVRFDVSNSQAWAVVELMHYILTPFIPFLLIVLFNVLTVRHILVASRARRRIRGPSSGESSSDPEMENRRKSIVVLFVISGNFILLWVVFTTCSTLKRLDYLGYPVPLPTFVREIGFMLQLLSCCTNTFIYAVTQRKFREELKNGVKYPLAMMMQFGHILAQERLTVLDSPVLSSQSGVFCE